MTRNLKMLGLALVAAFAMSAVAASAASAENEEQAYLTSDGPVTLTAEEVGAASENRLTSFGSFTSCAGSEYTGHKYDETPHVLMPKHTTTVTVTPHYVNCKSTALGLATTVIMNECDYVFHLGKTVNRIENTYDVTATVVCPRDNHIEVTVNVFGSHCTTTIEENEEGYKGLHVTDNTDGTIQVNGTATGIRAHREGPGCPGGTETTEEGELHQRIEVTGDNNVGEHTEIGISEEKETTEEV